MERGCHLTGQPSQVVQRTEVFPVQVLDDLCVPPVCNPRNIVVDTPMILRTSETQGTGDGRPKGSVWTKVKIEYRKVLLGKDADTRTQPQTASGGFGGPTGGVFRHHGLVEPQGPPR